MGIELGAKNLYKAYGVPSLDLTFADKKSLVDRISGNNLITFTRSSTATYVGSDGLIQTAASGAARFDHNPTTGESLGLLVEEARTNFVRQSETFGTTWTLFRASIVADSTASPDGAATADTMVEDTTVTSSHGTVQTINLTAATYTFTIFLKAAGRNWVNINPSDSTDHRTWFDFSNGVVGTNAAGNTSSIKAYPNGWYRCTITRTMDQVSCAFQISLTTGDNVAVYSGDGTSGAYIWGAQIEAGAFPTSYIPTTTATVTRAAEVVDITGGNFSSWFNSSVGTFFTDSTNMPLASNIALSTYNTNNTVAFALGTNAPDGGRAYLPLLGHLSNNTIIAQVFHYNGGGTNFGPTIQNTISNTANINKMAFYTDPPNQLFAVAVAGQIATLDTNFGRTGANSYTLANMMRIGYNGGFYGNYNGRIKRITYYPTRLSNSQLLTLIAT